MLFLKEDETFWVRKVQETTLIDLVVKHGLLSEDDEPFLFWGNVLVSERMMTCSFVKNRGISLDKTGACSIKLILRSISG